MTKKKSETPRTPSAPSAPKPHINGGRHPKLRWYKHLDARYDGPSRKFKEVIGMHCSFLHAEESTRCVDNLSSQALSAARLRQIVEDANLGMTPGVIIFEERKNGGWVDVKEPGLTWEQWAALIRHLFTVGILGPGRVFPPPLFWDNIPNSDIKLTQVPPYSMTKEPVRKPEATGKGSSWDPIREYVFKAIRGNLINGKKISETDGMENCANLAEVLNATGKRPGATARSIMEFLRKEKKAGRLSSEEYARICTPELYWAHRHVPVPELTPRASTPPTVIEKGPPVPEASLEADVQVGDPISVDGKNYEISAVLGPDTLEVKELQLDKAKDSPAQIEVTQTKEGATTMKVTVNNAENVGAVAMLVWDMISKKDQKLQ